MAVSLYPVTESQKKEDGRLVSDFPHKPESLTTWAELFRLAAELNLDLLNLLGI